MDITLSSDTDLPLYTYGYIIAPENLTRGDGSNCELTGEFTVDKPVRDFTFSTKRIGADNCPINNSPATGKWKLYIYHKRVQLVRNQSEITRPGDIIIDGEEIFFTQPGSPGTPGSPTTSQIFTIVQIDDIVPITSNTRAQVLLINAQQGNAYTFWWDKAQQNSLVYFANATENVPLSIGPALGAALDSEGPKKLCVALGDHRSILGLGCNVNGQFAEFKFVNQDIRTSFCKVTPQPAEPDDILSFIARNLKDASGNPYSLPSIDLVISEESSGKELQRISNLSLNKGELGPTSISKQPIGKYKAQLLDSNSAGICHGFVSFEIKSKKQKQQEMAGQQKCDPKTDPHCTQGASRACDPKTGNEIANGTGLMTAIGCVPTQPADFVNAILRLITAVGGGLAILLMFFGVFGMITSAGNPEAVKKGQDQMTAAAIGLVFILLAVLLLQIIGVDILNLPGFVKIP